MKRNDGLKVLNPVLGVLVLHQAVTAIFRGALGHEAYELLHGGGGILLVAGAAAHVVLNWNWVKASFFKKSSKS